MKDLKIKITEEAYQKLRYFTLECDFEISGLGKVMELEDVFIIYDIEILKQTVSRAHSSLDINDLAKFLNEKLIKKENIKDYKVWWHSHDNMDAYFSPIDDSTIELSTEFLYLISVVMNKREEMQARLDIFKPIRLTLPISVEVSLDDDEKIRKSCQQEITKKVSTWLFKKSISKGKKKSSTRKSSIRQSLLQDSEISGHNLELPSHDSESKNFTSSIRI